MEANFRTILAFASLGIILWVSSVGLMVEFGSGMTALAFGVGLSLGMALAIACVAGFLFPVLLLPMHDLGE